MSTSNKVIYLAGPLFGLADRVHNDRLASILENDRGYEVIVPHREAPQFMTNNVLDLQAMGEHCRRLAVDPNTIVVANLDGPDADSGTAFECGLAIAVGKKPILYRTDFRTDPEKEIGVNGMFKVGSMKLIYQPCYAISEQDFNEFYYTLAKAIHRAIMGKDYI